MGLPDPGRAGTPRVYRSVRERVLLFCGRSVRERVLALPGSPQQHGGYAARPKGRTGRRAGACAGSRSAAAAAGLLGL